MKSRWFNVGILGLILALSGVGMIVGSQSQTGVITGVVKDESTALIPGVTIAAVEGNNAPITAVTNERGVYTLRNVRPGTYSVTATLRGFETKNVPDVRLEGGTQVDVNFTLRVAPRPRL